MRKFNFLGMQFIVRLRIIQSGWSIGRLDKSIKVELGKLVIYKMNRNTFHSITSIVDRKGQVTVA